MDTLGRYRDSRSEGSKVFCCFFAGEQSSKKDKTKTMQMIDIARKTATDREAVVEGRIFLKPSVVRAIKRKEVSKGDVLEAAKVAGIMAAKKTPHIIPLCHPIPVEYVDVRFYLQKNQIRIKTTVKGRAKTGVEMEAFTATAISALTIYDMCKSLDKEIVIADMMLVKKTGGKSGTYRKIAGKRIPEGDFSGNRS